MAETTVAHEDHADDVKFTMRKAALEESEMDITPMIDCTFLLLIFFLVCSRINQQAAIALPPARHGATLADRREAVILTITAGNTATAMVYKGDGAVAEKVISNADPIAQEQEITRYVESEMRQASDPKTSILVKAEKKVKHREVARVIKAATLGVDIQKVHVAVQQSGG